MWHWLTYVIGRLKSGTVLEVKSSSQTELLAALVEGQCMLNEAMQTMAQHNRGGRHVRQGGEAN